MLVPQLVCMAQDLSDPAQKLMCPVSHVEWMSPEMVDATVFRRVIEAVDCFCDSGLEWDAAADAHER